MLRYEASVTDETRASYSGIIVRIKKIGMHSRAIGTEELQDLLFERNKKL
ncbi:hypothetical protein [Pedobacter suwonensis]